MAKHRDELRDCMNVHVVIRDPPPLSEAELRKARERMRWAYEMLGWEDGDGKFRR